MYISIIKTCIEESEKSAHKVHIGAVLFKGKRILATGHNAVRSNCIDPKFKNFPESLHAEQACLLQLNDWTRLKNCSMLVIKTSKTERKLGMARPCPYCQKFLMSLGIKDIYYSNQDGEIIHEQLSFEGTNP